MKQVMDNALLLSSEISLNSKAVFLWKIHYFHTGFSSVLGVTRGVRHIYRRSPTV